MIIACQIARSPWLRGICLADIDDVRMGVWSYSIISIFKDLNLEVGSTFYIAIFSMPLESVYAYAFIVQ